MKDLSYLEVFDSKTLRSTKRILSKGFTLEDIDRFLEETKVSMTPKKAELMKKMGWELKKPCGGCQDKENL